MLFRSSSLKTTQRLATRLAKEILRKRKPLRKRALVIGFSGDLGAGKTTFIQGFIRGLGLKRNIPSPTFLIVRSYPLKGFGFRKVFHVDAYRLKNTAELKPLDFDATLKDPSNIVLVEWAEKIKKVLPKNRLWLRISHGAKPNERILRMKLK